MICKEKLLVAGVAALVLVVAGTFAASAQTPDSAKKLIADFKLAPDVVADWEAEQAVPAAWIEGAKKEAKLRIIGHWESNVFRTMTKPFAERYPFITFTYTRRAPDMLRMPLVALKEGRSVADIMTGIDDALGDYRAMNALEDLSVLPNYKVIPEEVRSPKRDYVSTRVVEWCLAYNTSLISKDKMPKTWDDLLTTKELADQHIALQRGIHNWLLALWNVKGEDWAINYLKQLFTTMQPQKRKEGATALVNLLVAGEFSAVLAIPEYLVKEPLDKGAPVGFHCPDIVPMSTSVDVVLRDNPDINASRIFINWLLSKEGQVSQYAANGQLPIHHGLQDKGLSPFPQEVAGKKLAYRSPEQLGDDMGSLRQVLKTYWE